MNSNSSAYVSNFLWLFSDKAVQFFISFFVTTYLARHIGPSGFGLLGYAQSIVGIGATLVAFGTDDIIIKQIVNNGAQRSEYLLAGAIIRFVAGLIVFLVALVYYLGIGQNNAASILIVIMTAGLPFFAMNVLSLDFQVQIASKYTALARTVQSLSCSALRLGAVVANAPLSAFAAVNAIEAPVFGGILNLIHRKASPRIHFKTPNANIFKLLLIQGAPLLAANLSVVLYMRLDQIMLASIISDTEAGIYLAALRLSELWNFIPMIICSTVYPGLLAAKATGSKNYTNNFLLLYELFFLISLIIVGITISSSHYVIPLFFGVDYSASASVLNIHIFSTIAVFLGVASNQWLMAENLQTVCLLRSVLGLAVNFFLNLLLIPKFGAQGAAAATAIAFYFTTFVAPLFHSRSRCLTADLFHSMFFNALRSHFKKKKTNDL